MKYMRIFILALLCGIAFGFASYSDDKVKDLRFERTGVILYPGQSDTVKILEGSGDYRLRPYENRVVDVKLEDNIIIIRALSEGYSPIEIIDSESVYGSIYVTVKPTHERYEITAYNSYVKVNNDSIKEIIEEDLGKIIEEKEDLPSKIGAYYLLSTRDSALIVYPDGLNGTSIEGMYEKTETQYTFKYNNEEYVYYINKLPAARDNISDNNLYLLQDRTAFYRNEYKEEEDIEIEGVALVMTFTKRN